MTLIATLFAMLALNTQGYELPKDFTANIDQATPSSSIIGMEWPCAGKYADETCWAGLDTSSFMLETGP